MKHPASKYKKRLTKRPRHINVLTFRCMVGNPEPLIDGYYPLCPRCGEKVKLCTLSLVQTGFFENRETDVFYCKDCGTHSSFTYDIKLEDENGD